MLCNDCLIEDGAETEAVTVQNGFALCRSHLFSLNRRYVTNADREMKKVREFLDRELGLERPTDT